MSNMSYCHFENTATDFGDCVAALEVYDFLGTKHYRVIFADGSETTMSVEQFNETFEVVS